MEGTNMERTDTGRTSPAPRGTLTVRRRRARSPLPLRAQAR
jgi:hypothetical protein